MIKKLFQIGLYLGLAITALSVPPAYAQAYYGGLEQSPQFPEQPDGQFTTGMTDIKIKVPNGYVTWRRDFNGYQWQFNTNWATLGRTFQRYVVCCGEGSSSLNAAPVPPKPTFGGTQFPGYGMDLSEHDRNTENTQNGPLTWLSRNNATFMADSDYGSFLQVGTGQRYMIRANVKEISSSIDWNGPLFRWQDRNGDWIDYDRLGAIHSYGNANGLTATIVYETFDNYSAYKFRRIKGVKDRNGNTVLEIDYFGARSNIPKMQVREVLLPGETWAPRVVNYEFDQYQNLTKVIDARGQPTEYTYNYLLNSDSTYRSVLSKITDALGRTHQIVNPGRMSREIAADGGVTDYVYDYDKTKKEFFVRTTKPETAAGRQVEEKWYDRGGSLLRTVVNGRLVNEYAVSGRESTSLNSLGFPVKSTIDEFNQVVKVTNPDDSSVSYKYSAIHLKMTESTDEEGISTKFEYDEKGNLTKQIQAVGTSDERITLYEYDAFSQLVKRTEVGRTENNGVVTPDAVWLYEYGNRGLLTKMTDPEENAHQYVYRSDEKLLKYIDPRGNATTYEVDQIGNVTNVINALKKEHLKIYDKVGNPVVVTDSRMKTLRLSYDALNRIVKSTDPADGNYIMQYDKAGQMVEFKDQDGLPIQIGFDSFQRKNQVVDGLGNITKFSYQELDSNDKGMAEVPSKVIYPTYSEEFEYDKQKRVIRSTQVNQNSQGTEKLQQKVEYNKRGEITSKTDANNHTSFYVYNAFGQVIEATDSLGKKTQYKYDARGNLIQLTDALGNEYRSIFDRNNRVIQEILPIGQTVNYAYDPNGNLLQKIDANGNKAVYEYDVLNRVTKVNKYKSDSVLTRSTAFSYDLAGNAEMLVDTDHSRNQSSKISTVYDNNNRKTNVKITYPSGFAMQYSYRYSAAGRKTSLIWPDGTEILYSYSAHGKLENVTIPSEGSLSVNQFKWVVPNKVTLPGGVTQERELDGLLNMQSLVVKAPDSEPVLKLVNVFGKEEGPIQSKRMSNVNGRSQSGKNNYSFDNENRLTAVQTDGDGMFAAGNESFSLDAVGNRISHSKVDGDWKYDKNNRLLKRGSGINATQYEYDAAGNLIKKIVSGQPSVNYVYDTQNRLVEISDSDGNLFARYGYDTFSRRLWKEQFRNADGKALTQAKRSYFLYADEGLLAEAQQDITLNGDQSVVENNSPSIVVQYGPVPDSPFTTANLFLKSKNSNGDVIVSYLHNDYLGTPQMATDKAGNVVWSASFDAFGRAKITTPSATVDKPTIEVGLRLPGQVEDQESGLHYNYFRYYDPTTGRYLQSDPIGLVGGVNTFSYAMGNPLAFVDPTGLCIEDLCIGEAIIVGRIAWQGYRAYQTYRAVTTLAKALSPADEAQKQIDNDNYHNTCDKPPPPGMSPCEAARWQYRQALSCQRKRQEWEERWGTEQSKAPHERALANVKNRLKNAAADIARFCTCG